MIIQTFDELEYFCKKKNQSGKKYIASFYNLSFKTNSTTNNSEYRIQN